MNEVSRFIWEHRDDDPAQLALSAKKHPGWPLAYIARQVDALSKVRRKIPAWYREGLEFPVALSLEQASSEATARFKSCLFSGALMADLTGGLGVDTSFFAQQFAQANYVEKIPEIFEAAQHNLGLLGFENVAFHHCTAEEFLAGQEESFDLLYIDPARRDERKGKVFRMEDCSPNVLDIKALLLKCSPKVLLKTAPLLDIHQALQQLKNVSKVWVLEYEGDCREVLYLLEREAPAAQDVPIVAVSLDKSGETFRQFTYTIGEEQQAQSGISAPLHYLYEPSPAVFKAGAFRSFATRFGLYKLHANTHLYTSEHLQEELPGRSFRIDAVCKYERKSVESVIPEGKANIATRNFPDNPEQVRKKLGLRDGGDVYLFAATAQEGKRVILVCRKV